MNMLRAGEETSRRDKRDNGVCCSLTVHFCSEWLFLPGSNVLAVPALLTCALVVAGIIAQRVNVSEGLYPGVAGAALFIVSLMP